MSSHGADSPTAPRSGVVAWALWDCGATGVNAVVVTFVFSVYLTEHVRRPHVDRPQGRQPDDAAVRALAERGAKGGGDFDDFESSCVTSVSMRLSNTSEQHRRWSLWSR
jgi:MFS-type transporter involved in bile tolerance (Atg22 family)